jgi:hypothetical protein
MRNGALLRRALRKVSRNEVSVLKALTAYERDMLE